MALTGRLVVFGRDQWFGQQFETAGPITVYAFDEWSEVFDRGDIRETDILVFDGMPEAFPGYFAERFVVVFHDYRESGMVNHIYQVCANLVFDRDDLGAYALVDALRAHLRL
jgi:predicted GTPase